MNATLPAFQLTADQQQARKLLTSEAKFILLAGGSRSGKTFLLLRFLLLRAIKTPNSRHVILRLAFNHLKTSVWYDTLPKVIDLCFPKLPYEQNRSDWFIKLYNGSTIWFGGLDDKERTEKILGNEYATIYFNEISQISYSSYQLALTRLAQKTTLTNKVYCDCNPPGKSHWSYKLFYLHQDPLSGVKLNPDLYAAMLLNPEGNRQNLSQDYIETVLDTLSEAQRNRFKHGIWAEDNDNALFRESYLQAHRVNTVPPLRRIVVAVDPAVSANSASDETGIVAAALGVDGHAYVLGDYSGVYTPLAWAKRVGQAMENFGGDCIVCETNQGGDLVTANIRQVLPNARIKTVHAYRGKVLRAEPVVALYEQGKVHHVGVHHALESQMTSWNPSESYSPDRVDALVYALTDLLVKNTNSNW